MQIGLILSILLLSSIAVVAKPSVKLLNVVVVRHESANGVTAATANTVCSLIACRTNHLLAKKWINRPGGNRPTLVEGGLLSVKTRRDVSRDFYPLSFHMYVAH